MNKKEYLKYMESLSHKEKVEIISEVFMKELRNKNWKFCDSFMTRLKNIIDKDEK